MMVWRWRVLAFGLGTNGLVPSEPRRQCSFNLFQYLFIRFLVEPDDDRPPYAQRGCAQVSRRSEHQGKDRGIVRPFIFEIDMHHLLSPGGIEFVGAGREGQCHFVLVFRFSRVDPLIDADSMRRKKLLRFAAGDSTRAMIAPIDSLHGSFIMS